MRHLPGDNQERKPAGPAFTDAVKRQFRELVSAITHRAPAPEPEQRRRRGEDTGRAFRMAARKIMRRTARLPIEAYAAATGYLSDTLDWLNQWHHPDDDASEDFQPMQSDHLYPHL